MEPRVDIYCRVSTERQTEGYSIQEQESKLRAYAALNDWVINDVLIDGGYSGGNMNRPALQRMIADVQQHRVNKVIVYKLDRLSRSQKETMFLIEDVFIANKVDFVSMTENLDTGTPLGMAMIGILSVFAQLERNQIKERMQLGMDARIQSGKPHCKAHAPTGYRYEDGRIVQSEFAPTVRLIFERYLNGEPCNAICRSLNAEGNTGKIWYNSAVCAMLKNPIYTGYQRYKGELVRIEDIEPIISEELFDKVQDVRKRRTGQDGNERPQTAYKHVNMLGGLVWCGKCGKRYNHIRVPGYKGVKTYQVYCSNMTHSDLPKEMRCTNPSIRAAKLDEMVLEQVRKLNADRSLIEEMATAETGIKTERESLNLQLATIEQQNKRLIDLYTLGRFEISELTTRADALEKKRESIINRLSEIEKNAKTHSIDSFKKSLDTFAAMVDNSSPAELHDVIHALIKSITITGHNVDIQWNF